MRKTISSPDTYTAPPNFPGLIWPKLETGFLLKRYKRFLADVRFPMGKTETVHCPNSGSMLTCCEPGRAVYLSTSDNMKRRCKYTWEMIQMQDSLVGVNTLVPNRLVKQAVACDQIEELRGYPRIKREVKCSPTSRLDLLLEDPERVPCYIEIKNCTLVEDGTAYFPDAVTSRGLKHLQELQQLVKSGNRGVIFFLVQRCDAKNFRAAAHIDPDYSKELEKSLKNGVELLCYDTKITLDSIEINSRLPFQL